MKSFQVKLKLYIPYFISIIISSFIINYAFGYHGAKGIDVIFVALVLIFFSFYTRLQKLVLTPILILLAAYFPIGYLYGQPSLAIVASVLQTNDRESLEFIKSVPLFCYALPALIAISFVLLNKFSWSISFSPKTKRIYISVLAIFIVITGANGSLEKIKAVNFITSTASSFSAYSMQIEQLRTGNLSAQWSVTQTEKKDFNVVLIIGESMRTDYMSVFGYPLETTPFLNGANGTFYKNYISTAPNTFLSLPRTLALSTGKDVNISYNIVNLAKQAGFETFWYSNQGFLGNFDLPTSKIATYSDHEVFLKKGDFESLNTDDDALLPYLSSTLSSSKGSNKFIVLHIMGSHPQFTDRLNGVAPYFINTDKDISDYISTYRKTDDFIRSTYNILSKNGRPFKLIYFSDHGLSKRKIDGKFYLRHGSLMKQNYNVPLLVLSDTDIAKKYINTPKSAYNFLSFFANEIGVKITLPKLQSWNDNDSVKVFDGNKIIDYDRLGNEPAVELK